MLNVIIGNKDLPTIRAFLDFREGTIVELDGTPCINNNCGNMEHYVVYKRSNLILEPNRVWFKKDGDRHRPFYDVTLINSECSDVLILNRGQKHVRIGKPTYYMYGSLQYKLHNLQGEKKDEWLKVEYQRLSQFIRKNYFKSQYTYLSPEVAEDIKMNNIPLWNELSLDER